ncbi:DNA-directed RNA polymerase subunit omega [bacterium]|nr:DNA-directed RNA polymerase subunit omega [bacterium]
MRSKKYIFTHRGAIEDKTELFNPELGDLTKYELVQLISKRAREINRLRIELQKKYRVHLIEKKKPTMIALREYLDGELKGTYEKKEEE